MPPDPKFQGGGGESFTTDESATTSQQTSQRQQRKSSQQMSQLQLHNTRVKEEFTVQITDESTTTVCLSIFVIYNRKIDKQTDRQTEMADMADVL